MKLGTYTFQDDPDRWDPPRYKVRNNIKETFGPSFAYFSWGSHIIGRLALLEWDRMSCDQFNRFEIPYLAETTLEWDPEVSKKLFHGAVTNGPFEIGKTITGSISGATATVSVVWGGENYIEITPIGLVFQVGETITDNSTIPKSALVTSFENIGKYNVRIFDLRGKYVEFAGPNIAAFREAVGMELLILSVV